MQLFNKSYSLKITLLFVFSVGFSSFTQAQEGAPQKWTLQECIQYALDHNIDIQQANLDLQNAEIDKSDALGNYLPSISGNISNSWNSGLTQDVTTGILKEQTTRNLSVGATASITLFNGLRNLREWQRAKLSRIASQYSLEQMKNDVLLNVTTAYLNVLVNREKLGVLQEQNQLTQKQLEDTRTKIEEGAAPAGDSLQIKATDASEKQQIITAQNSVKIALINLAQLLQIDDYKNFRIAQATYDVPLATILSKSPEEIIASAKRNRYEIKIAQKNLELAQKDLQIAKSAYYPRLSAYFNFNTRESGAARVEQGGIDPNNPTNVIGKVVGSGADVVTPNFILREVGPRPFFNQLSRNKGYSFGLQLSIPILNGFSTRNSVRRQKITIKKDQNALDQAKLNLASNVYQAYVDAQGAAKTYRAAQIAVQAQQKAYDFSKIKFDVGNITSLEFSQAKFNLTNAESQLVNAKYDYIFKLKLLELYFGVRPEDINLN